MKVGRRVNKKCMAKVGTISIAAALTITLILLASVILASASQDQYTPGEKIKIEIGDIGEYSLIIQTPTQTLIQKSTKSYFIYQPIQEGDYTIKIESEETEKEIKFQIRDSGDKEPVEEIPIEKTETKKIQEPRTSEPTTQQPTIGQPYKWKKKFDKSSEFRSIKIPKSSTNISITGNPEIDFKVKNKVTDSISNIFSSEEEKSLIVANIKEDFEIEYETPAPTKSEKIISNRKKEVEISSELHYENVLAFTSLTEELAPEKESSIKVYWKEESKYLDFQALDTNNNTLLDKIEWTVPHLSTQTFEIIIEISDAIHMDSNKSFIENIFGKVNKRDEIWQLIPEDNYIRVTFEKNLTSKNDITIYAKPENQTVLIEVYEKNSNQKLAEFEEITKEGSYKIFLTALTSPADTFDLLVKKGAVLLDLIIDPFTQEHLTGFETGLDGWSDPSDDVIRNTDRSYCDDTSCAGGGSWALEIKDDAAGSYSEQTFDLSTICFGEACEYITFSFWAFYEASIDAGEELDLKCDGTTIWSCYPENGNDPADDTTQCSGSGNLGVWKFHEINLSNPEFGSCTIDSSVTLRLESEYSQNTEESWIDGINITGFTSNTAPIPTPEINSTDGTNSPSQDLNCFDTLFDNEGDSINVSIRWYKDDTLNLSTIHNNNYANSTFFNTILSSPNTSIGEDWMCSMQLTDGIKTSSWINSSMISVSDIFTNYNPITCTDIWGNCGVGEPGNTFDACANSAGTDERINEIYLNSTAIVFGDTIQVTCEYYTSETTGDELYIYYRNSSSAAWVQKAAGSSSGTGSTVRNWTTLDILVDSVIGEHQIRCIIDDVGENDECASGSYFDNDDVNFTVSADTNEPTDPTPEINSTDGSRKPSQDLNCFDIIMDPNNDSMNVSTRWYNNDILNLIINYNDTYASGFFFNAILSSTNTSDGDNWMCSMQLTDGTYFSSWINSSSIFISNIFLDYTERTCTDVWGNCGIGESDNTFDTCANGAGGDERINEIYLNATSLKFGDTIQVTCEYYSTETTADELYVYYRNSSSAAWAQQASGSSSGTGSTLRNWTAVSISIDSVIGEHQIRCIIDFDGENDECAGGSWFDNDDINFTVSSNSTAPITPTPEINSTSGDNDTSQDLNCFDTLLDTEARDINVSVRWYKNGTLDLETDYNNNYANGTEFNTILNSGNTTLGDEWMCSLRYTNELSTSPWANSTTLTILPTPVTVGLETIYPTSNIDVYQNEFFNVTLNLTCLTGDCGTVNITLDPIEESFENFETGEGGFTHQTTVTIDEWHRSSESSHDGTYSFKYGDTGTGDYQPREGAYLQTPVYEMKANSTFSFRHYMQTEARYDAGKLEYMANESGTWTKVTSFISGGYTGTKNGDDPGFTNNEDVWTTLVGGPSAFALVEPNLTTINAENITFRFIFVTDPPSNGEGWYVDSVNFTTETSGGTKGVIPMNSGTPFYTTTQNPFTSNSLAEGEYQTVTFNVNATGELSSIYEFFAYANQTADQTKSDITSRWNVTIIENIQPVNITINAPTGTTSDPTPMSNITISQAQADTLWYNLDGGANITICNDCIGEINQPMFVDSEGTFQLNVYANNSNGDVSYNSTTFTIDMNNNFYDTFDDNHSVLNYGAGTIWKSGSLNYSGSGSTSNFYDFETGELGDDWDTYISTAYGRIGVRTEDAYSGTYAVIADSSLDGEYELSELISQYDYSGTSFVNLSFWFREFNNDETNAGSDHSGHDNSDAVYYTCDGNYWYHLYNLIGSETWEQVNITVGDDPDFCSEINSSFAIKFTQYDNYNTVYDGIGWDDIRITYDGIATSNITSRPMHTTDVIAEFTNISWNYLGTGNVTIQLSANNGTNRYNATNNQDLVSITGGNYLRYNVIFSGTGNIDLSLLDLNITWKNAASPPPGITINSPSSGTFPDVTPILNVTLDATANNLWYTLNEGSRVDMCTTCSGDQDLVLYLQEGSYTVAVYADNSIGIQNSESVSFTVDMAGNYFDTYMDDSQIWSYSGPIWELGNITYQDSITGILVNETFENMSDWSPTGGDWNIVSGEMVYSTNDGNPGVFAINDNVEMESGVGYDIRFTAYDDDNDENALVFRYKDSQNHYKCAYSIQVGSGLEWGLIKIEGGVSTFLNTTTALYTENAYNDYRATIENGKITCYLNGAETMSASDTTWEDGAVGVYADYHLNVRYDNFTVEAWTTTAISILSYPITTIDNIVEIINVTWNNYIENSENNITVQISTDDGSNWHDATSGLGVSGTELDKDLVYRVLFDVVDKTILSLLDLNITWTHSASPPPTISVTSPGNPVKDTTLIIGTNLTGQAVSYWYTINDGTQNLICEDCTGSQPALLLLEEGNYEIGFYANNSVGAQSTEALSFEVDMQRNYYDTFNDSSQIYSINVAEWMLGNITYEGGGLTIEAYETFDSSLTNWTALGGTWSVSSGSMQQTGNTAPPGGFNLYDNVDMESGKGYNISYSAYDDDNDENALIFRYKNSNNYYMCAFTRDTSSGLTNGIIKTEAGVQTNLASITAQYTENAWNDYAVVVEENNISCYLNGALAASVVNDSWEDGQVGLFETYHQNTLYDNFTVKSWDAEGIYTLSHAINVSQNIRRISNITWTTAGTDINNIIGVNLSVDSGINWFQATNGLAISGFTTGQSLVYKIFFSNIETRTTSLLDLNITWEEPPSINILYPENSYVYNSQITKMNYTVSVSGSETLDTCWYTTDNGAINTTVTCGVDISVTSTPGTNTWTIYANDSSGTQGSDTVTFIVDTAAPSIVFINQSSDPLDEGANFEVYINATDSGLEAVWITIWETVIGGAIRFTGLLSNLVGDLFKATVPTDETYNGTYNYTIYANDSTGLFTNYSGNFSILKMYFHPDSDPLYSDGVNPMDIIGSLELDTGSPVINHPFNIWFEGSVIPFENLTANGVYLSNLNFTGKNDIFDESYSENITYNGTVATLAGTNTSGEFTGTMDAGALVNWSYVDWTLLSEGCSGTIDYYDGNSWGYDATMDTYIDGTSPTSNYNSEESILLDTSPDIQRGLLKFSDMFGYGYNKIPHDSSISLATMSVNVYDTGNAPTVYEILEDWSDSVATYNGRLSGTSWSSTGVAGSPSRSTTSLGVIPATTTGSKSLTVTDLVKSWNNRSSTNYGVVFNPGGSSGIGLRSSEYTITATDRPRMDITFSSTACAGVEVFVRTSQDQNTWSGWNQVFVGESIPDSFGLSRYLQYEIKLGAYNATLKPYLYDIAFNYSATITDATGGYDYSWTTPTTFGSYDINLTSGLRTIKAAKYIELRVQSGINPVVTLLSPENNRWSNTADITFQFNATDLNGDLALASLVINDSWVSNNQSALIDGGINEINHTFSEGVYSWRINASDSSGLDDESENRTIYIDLTSPNITLHHPSNDSTHTVGYLNLSFTPADNMDTSLTCNVTLDGSNIFENQEYTNGTIINVSSGAVTDGLHYWNVTCQDNSLRTFTSETREFNISDTPPTVSLLSPEDNYISSSQDVNFTFFPEDNSGITICELLIDGAYAANVTNPELAKNTTILLTGMSEGFYNWSIRCEDLSSTIVDSENRTIGIDTTGPTVEIFAPIDNYNSSSAIQDFDIRINDSIDSLLSCDLVVAGSTLDTFNATSGIRFNFTSSPLEDGISAWYLNCSDSTNHYTTSTPRNINISQAPTVVLNNTNETYISGTSFTVYYTPSDNTDIDSCAVYLNGAENQSSSSITNNAQNFFDLDDLGDGIYIYYVTCEDAIALSASTQTFQFTIDNVAPVAIPLFPLNEDVFAANVTFNFTAIDELSSQLNCSVLVDSTPLSINNIFTNNTNSTTTISGLSDGTHDWNLTCYDQAGNSNTSSIYNFTRYTAPGISLISPENVTWLNYSDVTFIYFPEDDEGFNKAELFINGAFDQENASIMTSGANNNFTKTLPEGEYTWYVEVTDITLTSTTSQTRTFYVDTSAPTIQLGLPAQDETYNTNNVTFNFSTTDNLDPGITCDLYVGTDREWTGNLTNATEEKVNLLLVDGNYTYKINCSDSARNQVTSTETNFTVFAPPRINLLLPTDITYTQNSSINFSYTPIDALGFLECSIYLDEIKNETSYAIVENVRNNFTISGIQEGYHNWSVECIDSDSNLNTSQTRVFYRDITPPTILLNAPENNTYVDGNNDVLFNWTPSDTFSSFIPYCTLIVDGTPRDTSPATSGFPRTELIAGLSIGEHEWNVTCTDQAGNTNTSETRIFNYAYTDFLLNQTLISVSDINPTENETITINATVHNLGGIASLVEVKFYNEDPEDTGVQIGATQEILLQPFGSNTSSIQWNASLGSTNIFAIVDFPDTITELNETNNKANITISVQSWHFFYGSISPSTNLTLSDSSTYEVTNWNMANATQANIYVTDYDSSIDWLSLQAIGKDTSGTASTNDIQEIDTALNMTLFKDSHGALYLNSSFEINETRDYTVFTNLITEVPITDSINSSNFKTGILWDTSDDSDTEYDSTEKEDIIYITSLQKSTMGSYEITDYELRVPANLRNYDPTNQQTAIFYLEII